MGSEEPPAPLPLPSSSSSYHQQQQKKIYWRSASWSSSRSDGSSLIPEPSKPPSNGHRRFPNPPLTPRSKSRSSLPPLQPLSIARRSLDEWPKPGSDDLGEWPHHPPTPSASSSASAAAGEDRNTTRNNTNSSSSNNGIDHHHMRSAKNQIAFFDKECSKVADHIYLGGDSVARNREILRRHGITHVLNCVGFVCPEYFKSDLVYKTLWLQDSPSEDITSILYDVFDYFEDVRDQGGRVFVHCCQGVSRSTSLVIAYLMWRKGQSFDDAFQFVKAARGIANPNMGFACQLLQCQKRVHAIPLSPNSVLRMYRMAPHSPYDPLHLVPKMLNEPSPANLDSRGAFIVHVVPAIYVWVGKGCDLVMEKDAKAAAFQVVRYERVPGPVVAVGEGEEPAEFWEAFSGLAVSGPERVGKTGLVGKRRVESYDVDFELFYKAISGGVVPPFPPSGPGQETRLPAREGNWSILRRKFISGRIKMMPESAVVRDADPCGDRVQVLTVEASPPYFSPSSLSSDSSSSSSSKCCSDSPSISPSTCSSPSLTPTNLPDSLLSLTRPSLQSSNASSPSKGLACSIAERRGSFSLKLPLNKDAKDTLLLPRKVINVSPNCVETKQEIVERSNGSNHHTSEVDAVDKTDCERQVRDIECFNGFAVDSSDNVPTQSLSDSTESVDIASDSQPSLYSWPDMEKLTKFSREDLDSKPGIFLITPKRDGGEESDRVLYMWVGSRAELANGHKQLKSCTDVDGLTKIDWIRVGCDFLALMGLPNEVPVKVFKEQEPQEFLELVNSNEFPAQ